MRGEWVGTKTMQRLVCCWLLWWAHLNRRMLCRCFDPLKWFFKLLTLSCERSGQLWQSRREIDEDWWEQKKQNSSSKVKWGVKNFCRLESFYLSPSVPSWFAPLLKQDLTWRRSHSEVIFDTVKILILVKILPFRDKDIVFLNSSWDHRA